MSGHGWLGVKWRRAKETISSRPCRRSRASRPYCRYAPVVGAVGNDAESCRWQSNRAYFYAPARRPLFILIPAEHRELGDEKRVAQLNLILYGSRDTQWAPIQSSSARLAC